MLNCFLAILVVTAWIGIICHGMHLQAVRREREMKALREIHDIMTNWYGLGAEDKPE